MVGESGSKAMGSLYDLLLDFVDSSRAHDSNYDIASELVRNYKRLPAMSLRQMSELCYVSPASFSRFCRFMGFDSFAEFKDALDSANYVLEDDYSRAFLSALRQGEEEALGTYRSSLTAVLNSTLDEENLRVVSDVIDALVGAERVAFFSHHFLWHIGRYLQGRLMLLGRYVELPQSFEHQLEAAESLGPDDVAIICSINGTYLSHYQDIAQAIFASGAKVVVLTQNRHAIFLNRADYVLTCGNSNENDIGKYAALMTVDYLVMSYLRRKMAE